MVIPSLPFIIICVFQYLSNKELDKIGFAIIDEITNANLRKLAAQDIAPVGW